MPSRQADKACCEGIAVFSLLDFLGADQIVVAGVGAGDGVGDGGEAFLLQLVIGVAGFFQQFAQLQAHLIAACGVEFPDAGADGVRIADESEDFLAVLSLGDGVQVDGVAVKPAHVAGVDALDGPADGAVELLQVGEIPVFFREFYLLHGLQHVHALVHAVQGLEQNGLDGVPEIAQGGLDFLLPVDGQGVAGEEDLRPVGENEAQGVNPGGDVPVLAAADGVEVGPAAVVIVAAAEDFFLRQPDEELVVGLAGGGDQL